MQQEILDKDLNTYGFLGYPVLQAADIVMYASCRSGRTRPPISS